MEITKENLGRYFYQKYKDNDYLGISNEIYTRTVRRKHHVVTDRRRANEVQQHKLEQYQKVISELVNDGYIERNGHSFYLKSKLKEFAPKKFEIFVNSPKEIQSAINVVFWILLLGVIVYFWV